MGRYSNYESEVALQFTNEAEARRFEHWVGLYTNPEGEDDWCYYLAECKNKIVNEFGEITYHWDAVTWNYEEDEIREIESMLEVGFYNVRFARVGTEPGDIEYIKYGDPYGFEKPVLLINDEIVMDY